jgi:hypothetical protein
VYVHTSAFSAILKLTYSEVRRLTIPFSKLAYLVLLCLPASIVAATISGSIKDPSGAFVPQARIEIAGPALTEPLVLMSDPRGQFASVDLKPGTYSIRITAEGFEPLVKSIVVSASPILLELQLELAHTKQELTVTGKTSQFANSDPMYRTLRSLRVGVTLRVENFTLKSDVAAFQMKQGTLTFLAPVQGKITGAIFIGEGHFHLKPATIIDRRELNRRAKTEELDEDFSDAVFRFTGQTHQNLLQGCTGEVATPPAAAAIFEQWQEKVRRRREIPLGFSESLLTGEAMDNVDAEILASLYNPHRPDFFTAYLRGAKHKDLRYFFRPRSGAIPALDSPDEVALINYDPESLDDGLWYLAHRESEYLNRTASSLEEKRYVAARKFKIETVIANNDHLAGLASVTFESLLAGDRLVKFQLLPNLRVTRVSDLAGKDLYYIQEPRKADGSLYVILPEPTEVGKNYSVTVEYSGDHVVFKAGNGSFYVQAREAWYPNLNGFSERALYDLTYKVPKQYKLISVGTLDKEWTEGNFAASHWTTRTPVAVAGFNFGEYKRLELPDEITSYRIEGYYLPELPSSLAQFSSTALSGMAPGSMTKYVLDQTRAQLQLCTFYFGKIPLDHIYITEQPNFNFGQSWPNLVYLPISAYIDSTQRWLLFGRINNKLTAFVQEVTPHEVAHQWWGHAVGWASYHDQWLSEGFAEFSAGLFLQQAVGKNWQKDYVEFWDRLRRRILEKNEFGASANESGPVWLGVRLISPRSGRAYQDVTYAKGAYILSMLRSIMYSTHDKDKAFIDMMHDFVASHSDMPASTESFKAIAEKHVAPAWDVQRNGSLDWFFNEWVYGTEVPRYRFEYELTPSAGGKTKLHMSITQSEVDPNFVMFVPIYVDFGKGFIRLGQLPVLGNSTRSDDVELPEKPHKVVLNAFKEVLER